MTLESALTHLSERQRTLIQLRDQQKLKWVEVSAEMGLSQNYLYKLYREAKVELARYMAMDEKDFMPLKELAGKWTFKTPEEPATTPPAPKSVVVRGIPVPNPYEQRVMIVRGIPVEQIPTHPDFIE